jgi:putative endonuclease
MTNQVNTVLYTGVTDNLIRRIDQHKNKLSGGFTYKYNINKLVFYEIHEEIIEAIKREKQIKNWHREWKINLIKSINPEFKDLYPDIIK